MNILYCGDKNIADGVLISVLSLTKHSNEPLNVYILTVSSHEFGCEALPQSFALFLDSILKKLNAKSSAKLIDVTEHFNRQIPIANIGTRFTPCCMLRLFADDILDLPERILYLDNDVVCRADFSDFYYQDINSRELAGVLDHYGKWFFRNNLFKMDYINSGVLLLNLSEIRRTGLFKKCRVLCADKKMFMPDQSAINKLAKNKALCQRRFNEQRRLQGDTVFHHFTTSFRFFPFIRTVTVKPWQTERVHNILNIYEYDPLLEEYANLKSEYLKGVKL